MGGARGVLILWRRGLLIPGDIQWGVLEPVVIDLGAGGSRFGGGVDRPLGPHRARGRSSNVLLWSLATPLCVCVFARAVVVVMMICMCACLLYVRLSDANGDSFYS